MTTATVTPSPSKSAAKRLLLKEFERVGERWNRMGDDQLDLLRQRKELEELWELADFGEEPPEFAPTMPLARRLA